MLNFIGYRPIVDSFIMTKQAELQKEVPEIQVIVLNFSAHYHIKRFVIRLEETIKNVVT